VALDRAARVPRLFVETEIVVGTRLTLPPATARHARFALRLRTGDELTLFNGQGGEYSAHLKFTGDVTQAEVVAFAPVERESARIVTLAQCIPANEKMDWIVEKSVELGVNCIAPLQSERSVVRLDAERAQSRRARWEGLCRAACEQCGRNRLPEVRAPQRLDAFLAGLGDVGQRALLHVGDAAPLLTVIKGSGPACLLVGPEGGLTQKEVRLACDFGFTAASLGAQVLRAETAALAGLALLQVKRDE
jgi:16S rRNA (uracil1498-N3)-methyltransferase